MVVAMNVDWSASATVRARVLPFPGKGAPSHLAAPQPWAMKIDLKKAEAAIKKAGGGSVPASPSVDAEVKRGIQLRLNEQYDEKGNWAKDTLPRDLVDVWCARAGVAFATHVLVTICDEPQLARASTPKVRQPYKLRRDGLPWSRLREHLAAADRDRDAAHEAAVRAGARKAKHEARQGVAYAFCDQAWAQDDLKGALSEGYGQLAVIAALQDAQAIRDAMLFLMGERKVAGVAAAPKYQLIENLVPHVPTLMCALLGDKDDKDNKDDKDDKDLIVRAAGQAWNAAVRKPWLEIVRCLASTNKDAKAFVAQHG